MKKIIALLLSMMMVLSMAACGSSDASSAASQSAPASTAASTGEADGSEATTAAIPGLEAGTIDAAIAGQSMTAERSEQVDFAGPYFYATIVCVTKNDSPYADATSIADLAGGTCTAQIATIWYDKCLPQIENANILTASETAPAMLMALESNQVDFICTDMPTAQAAVAAYPDMKILDFSGTDGDFQFTDEERAENVNIGISVQKGNTALVNAINSALDGMTADDFNEIMAQAIAIQPVDED